MTIKRLVFSSNIQVCMEKRIKLKCILKRQRFQDPISLHRPPPPKKKKKKISPILHTPPSLSLCLSVSRFSPSATLSFPLTINSLLYFPLPSNLLPCIYIWIQCPKISLLLFKDGADLRVDSFSCNESLHTLSFGANVFTFLMISLLILKLMFLFLNFQTCLLSVVEVLLCSNLKGDLCKLNFVLNLCSVSPIYVSWLFEAVSVSVALYRRYLVRPLPSSGQEFFCRQLHSLLS